MMKRLLLSALFCSLAPVSFAQQLYYPYFPPSGITYTGATGALGLTGSISGTVGLTALQNTTSTTPAGFALAKFGIAAGTESGWTLNPAANDWVPIYGYVSSTNGRNRIWGINTDIDVISGNAATAWGAEFDLNVATANAADPHQTNHALGVDVVSGGTFAPSAAYSSFGTTAANRWKHGLWLDFVGGQAGSTLIKAASSNVSVDFGLDLSLAAVNFQGVRVGNTPAAQVAPVALRQFANGQAGLFIQRFTDTAPTGNCFQITNAANSVVLAQFDCIGNLTIPAGVVSAQVIQSSGVTLNPVLTGTTGSIGGGALGAGACTSGTVAVTNSTTAMSVAVSPVADPGTSVTWQGFVSAAGTVTVRVCALIALTPTATTYNVRVIQ